MDSIKTSAPEMVSHHQSGTYSSPLSYDSNNSNNSYDNSLKNLVIEGEGNSKINGIGGVSDGESENGEFLSGEEGFDTASEKPVVAEETLEKPAAEGFIGASCVDSSEFSLPDRVLPIQKVLENDNDDNDVVGDSEIGILKEEGEVGEVKELVGDGGDKGLRMILDEGFVKQLEIEGLCSGNEGLREDENSSGFVSEKQKGAEEQKSEVFDGAKSGETKENGGDVEFEGLEFAGRGDSVVDDVNADTLKLGVAVVADLEGVKDIEIKGMEVSDEGNVSLENWVDKINHVNEVIESEPALESKSEKNFESPASDDTETTEVQPREQEVDVTAVSKDKSSISNNIVVINEENSVSTESKSDFEAKQTLVDLEGTGDVVENGSGAKVDEGVGDETQADDFVDKSVQNEAAHEDENLGNEQTVVGAHIQKLEDKESGKSHAPETAEMSEISNAEVTLEAEEEGNRHQDEEDEIEGLASDGDTDGMVFGSSEAAKQFREELEQASGVGSQSGPESSRYHSQRIDGQIVTDSDEEVATDVEGEGKELFYTLEAEEEGNHHQDEEDEIEGLASDGDTDGMVFGSSEAAKQFLEELEQASGVGSQSGAESSCYHSQRIDGQIVTDSDEEVATDEEGEGKELFDTLEAEEEGNHHQDEEDEIEGLASDGDTDGMVFGSSEAAKQFLEELEQASGVGSQSGAESSCYHSQRIDGQIVTDSDEEVATNEEGEGKELFDTLEAEEEGNHHQDEEDEIEGLASDGDTDGMVFGSSEAAKQFLEELEQASGVGSQSGAESSRYHSQRIDGQIVTDSDEEVATDEEGEGKELFDTLEAEEEGNHHQDEEDEIEGLDSDGDTDGMVFGSSEAAKQFLEELEQASGVGSQSGAESSRYHSQRIDGQIVTDSDEEVATDEEGEGKELFDTLEAEEEGNHHQDEEDEIEGLASDGDTDGMVFGSSEAAKQFLEELEQASDVGSQSGAESSRYHSQRIDGQIVTDSDEEVATDEEGEGRELFDSAALGALLKAAAGADSDGGNITITSQGGSKLFSVERPAGLGTSLRTLKPAPRPNRTNLFTHSSHTTGGETETNLSEEEKTKLEKLQQLRVKFLRLVHRLGHSPDDSTVGQVLYRLALVAGRQTGQLFNLDCAKRTALHLETEEKDDLDFYLNILVLGKTGVGKSATINSIFGEEKSVIHAFEPGTTSVKEIVGTVDGVKIRVIDTPGLKSSGVEQGANRKVLASIKKFTRKFSPDIVLYVDRLDSRTRDLNDLPLLRSITNAFGASIWRSAIVTLTHAASAPPDGPSGSPLSYEAFVAQSSQVIQHSIGQAVGDMRMMNPSLMNPVSLVENHPACRRNRDGQKVLPNGQTWRPQLLLLCCSMKILSEASSPSKPQESFDHRKLFGFRVRSPPLPYLLSWLLQSRTHQKLSTDQVGDNGDSDIDLADLSDSDHEEDEDEYDQLLPPFKPLRKAQIAKLSKEQRKAYFEEYDYRVKLLQKKQWREEIRRMRDVKKKGKTASEDYGFEGEDLDQENGSPAAVPVPLPDMILPPSFDGDYPAYRYRFLEPNSQFLARPVLDTHGWDHDCGYDGVNLERSLAVASRFPAAVTVQVTKDKKEFNLHLDSSIAAKLGENGSSMAGFDIQNVGKQLAYVFRGETKFKNFKRNKTAVGFSVTFLGESVATGFKLEDQIALGKRLMLVGSTGTVRSQSDSAYGANLEVRLRDADFPIGQGQSSLGLSLVKWRGDLALGANLQSQFSIGRSSTLAVRAGLNNKRSGQITIRTSTSDQLQIALLGILPVVMTIYKSIRPEVENY